MGLKLVIGLLAKPGGGKGTFVSLLRDICYEHGYRPNIGGPRFSDALRKTAEDYGMLDSRENLQKIGQAMNAIQPGAISRAMGVRLEKDRNEIRIADGVRWLSDEEMIRSLGGLLVYVKAEAAVRFERIKTRAENDGDRNKTEAKFYEEDMAENEKYVDEIGARADFIIDNNQTLEHYKSQVLTFYLRYIAPQLEKKED